MPVAQQLAQSSWFDPEHDEVLFTFRQWFDDYYPDGREFPVTLCGYPDSRQRDLHAQTGEGHEAAIEKAREILAKRGLVVNTLTYFVGPTGVYYDVYDCVVIDSPKSSQG